VRPPLRILALAALAGCALDHTLAGDGGGLDVTIGGVRFRISSGGAVTTSAGLTLYLTDQPDTCAAVTQIPAGRATIFGLKVSGPAGSTNVAPGNGALVVQAAGTEEQRVVIDDGAVSWSMNGDGTTQLVSLDVGFAGTTDRLRLASLTLLACH
jgi:hypothetical protein